MEKTVKRMANFTATESTLLTHLAKKYVSLIENRKTNSVTWKAKKASWEQIASEFNCASISGPRSAETLRKKWENIKNTIKDKMTGQRKYALGTGGGPYLPSPKLNDDEKDVFDIIQLQVTGTKSYVDSDQDNGKSQASDSKVTLKDVTDVTTTEVPQSSQAPNSEVAVTVMTDSITTEGPQVEKSGSSLSIKISKMSPLLPECSSWSTYNPSLLRTPRAPQLEKNRTGSSKALEDKEEETEKENPLRRYRKRPFTDSISAQVDIQRKELLVLPGQNATFLCRVSVPIQYCRIELPGSRTYNLNKQVSPSSEVAYYGEGLDAGQCGFTIQRVDDRDNGNVKCTLGIHSEPMESVGTMQLVVAKAPKLPELDISRGTDSLRVYKIHDVLEASCIVRDGRPVANISWFLDDEPINESTLKMATVVDLAKENLQSKLQNLTKVLQPEDNGRYLKCVAFHPAYPNGYAETKRQLDVKFAPLAAYEPIDKFGYQIGKVGVINVTIEANPKPQIEWTIGGQKVKEGSTDNTGRIEAEAVKELGRGRYEVNLRLAAVNKQDTEIDYILTAYNDMGSQEYRIKISTSPEPEGVELGIGVIIAIVVVVLFVILLVSILIFAKVSGRWCFSGERDLRHIGESSDTESADVRPKERKTPIKLTSIFKKNKDKVLDEPEPHTEIIEPEESPVADREKPSLPEDDQRGLVYAELDLVRAELKPVVRNDDEKTEYAEIIYTQNGEDNDKTKETQKK